MQQKKQVNPKAAFELQGMMAKMAVINANPFFSKEKKMDKVLDLLCGLSDVPFNYLAPQIVQTVDTWGDVKYGNTYSEVDAILENHPKLKEYRALIIGRVNVCRKYKKLVV